MRFFFNFLLRNHFYFLFLILEAVAILMLVRSQQYPSSVFLNGTQQFTGSVSSTVNRVGEYFRLKETNKALAEENARLKVLLKSNYLVKDSLRFPVTDTTLKQMYTFTPAKVVHNSISSRNNYLMLNKGMVDGIRPDMAVISPDGIVGIVAKVSTNFSWVISVLHKHTKISAKIRKNGFVGTLVWDGMNFKQGSLKDIPANVLIAKGDTVVTSGYSNIFPQGLMIGRISSFEVAEGYNFYDITIDFSQDYNKLSWVYVVTDFFKEEKANLQRFTIDE